jgi:hypothetical protein
MTTDLFAGRMLSGERVLWSGQPRQGLMLMPRDALLIPFSLMWCGFAIFWEVSVTNQRAPGFFPLFGAMFVCVGLYFVVGRFLFDAWLRRDMAYAVTDRRVLIARPAPFARFIAISLERLPDVRLDEGSGGRGTIQFGQSATRWGNQGLGNLTPALDPTPRFLAIGDARRVFDLIQRTSAPRVSR